MPDIKVIQTNNSIAVVLTNTTNTLITTAGISGGWITALRAVNTGGTSTNLIIYRNTTTIVETVTIPANAGNNGTVRSVNILTTIGMVFDENGNRVIELAANATIHIKLATYSSDIHITGNRGDF